MTEYQLGQTGESCAARLPCPPPSPLNHVMHILTSLTVRPDIAVTLMSVLNDRSYYETCHHAIYPLICYIQHRGKPTAVLFTAEQDLTAAHYHNITVKEILERYGNNRGLILIL